jgi:hypothetical protein
VLPCGVHAAGAGPDEWANVTQCSLKQPTCAPAGTADVTMTVRARRFPAVTRALNVGYRRVGVAPLQTRQANGNDCRLHRQRGYGRVDDGRPMLDGPRLAYVQ